MSSDLGETKTQKKTKPLAAHRVPEESQPSVGFPDVLVARITGKAQDAIMSCLGCHLYQGTAARPYKAVCELCLGPRPLWKTFP